MAKTRMKTTPTRMQKDALMASAAATTTMATVAMAGVDDVRKRLRQCNAPKQQLRATSTIIVTAPKRTNSISSATSSMSHASDTCHSAHSDTDSPPPLPTAAQTTTLPAITALNTIASTPAPRTLNTLLSKSSDAHMNTLKNRKVYMITERCEESSAECSSSSNAAGQKRKMYLIMEENSTESNDGANGAIADAQKYLKSENGIVVTAPKKLTLYADKSDVVLTQNFEKILPEILHRIQAKDVSNTSNNVGNNMRTITTPPPATIAAPIATVPIKLHNGAVGMNIAVAAVAADDNNASAMPAHKEECMEHNKRLPITLPPKKNRTKIITTHINSNSNNHNNSNSISCNNSNNNIDNSNNVVIESNINCTLPPVQIKQISAATPVIVSTASLPPMHNNNNNNSNKKYTHNGQTSMALAAGAQLAPQKNINLSTDFLFLMKMLPMLESIPEPHKNNVKNYIEKIITQNANLFAKQ